MTFRAPGANRHARLRRARLYFVTDAATDDALLQDALGGGVDVLQLRDHEASDEELRTAAARFQALAERHDALFLVNDRPDLALEAGADGVHVGEEDLPVVAVRREVGEDLLIGLSTHAPGQLRAGLASEANYLSVGPVYETPTKAGRPATGIEYVRHAASVARAKPWFAIGGIDLETIGDVVEAGAERVVVVRAIRDAPDPRQAAAALRAALERRPVGAAQ